LFASLSAPQTTVDVDRLSGQTGSIIQGKEGNQSRHVIAGAESTEWSRGRIDIDNSDTRTVRHVSRGDSQPKPV